MTPHNITIVLGYIFAISAVITSSFGRFDMAAYLMAFAIWMHQ